MPRTIISPPDLSGAPLAELKQWLAIATAREDALLARLLAAAHETCERFTGLMPLECTVEERLDPRAGWLTLATRPVRAITAIELRCDDPDAVLTDADLAGLAAGANRLLIGEEIVQFALAQPRGEGRWRLAGLLRGRGAGEAEALAGHAAGTRGVLLDERLRLIDGAGFDPATQRLAAIGLGDVEPVFARVAAPGRSRQPLPPVHPIAAIGPTGDWSFGWTRRARGAWGWADGVETPLVEESERYEIGAGPPAAPLRLWTSAAAALTVPAAELAGLASGTQLWVRQLGSHAPSRAVRLHTLA